MLTDHHAAKALFPFTGDPESRVVDFHACIAAAHTMRALAFIRLMTASVAFLKRWVVEPVKGWHERRQMQIALMMLDDRMLADIGINRWEISGVVAEAVRAATAAGASTVRARTVKVDVTGDTAANDESRSLAA